jgi:uncharacterized protein (TIGR02300 family)
MRRESMAGAVRFGPVLTTAAFALPFSATGWRRAGNGPAIFAFDRGGRTWQVLARNCRRRTVAKPVWGIKRTCLSCGARFYDLTKTPIVCPSCEAVFDPEAVLRPRRSRAAPEPVAPKPVPAAKVADDDDDDLGIVDDDVDLDDDEDDDALEDTSDLEDEDPDVPGVTKKTSDD